MKRPLMGTDNILELQDNGYKSTVSAISEIIDNSIQANAKNVDIIIIKNTTRAEEEIDEILISDDGDGMDESIFNKALQMSSGSRSKAKTGLGKYGQGLPNSSISQTKRVEVYTVQNGNILYNHIDLNEIYLRKFFKKKRL
jgi:sensor histidine kinase regulating citrate/malate metabolism